MKLTKSIAVFLTLSMLISLNACMAKTSEQNTSTAEQTSEDEYQYHFISHKIHEKGEVTHPSLQKS